MFEHEIFTKQEIAQKIRQHLSGEYTFDWYMTDQLSVIEIQPEWSENIILAPQIIKERDEFVEAQRVLMNVAIAKVREGLLGTV